MTEPTTPNPETFGTTRASQIGWGVLICVTLYVCYFSQLGAIGFVGPDEPRYAWIARDMMESGDWVTPRLYGRPWFEKPPLFYWGAALSFKLFGVSEAAARLPSAISALLATLALAWLAGRLYGSETARWLLLLLPTTVGMIGFSHAAATDMPFSATLTIAMVCAAVVLGLTRNENTPVLPRTPWLGLILFGFFLGLAMLAKGPAAIILSGGAVFFWALMTKRWRDAFRLLHPAAIASFCATSLPWYILCARRNPDFVRVFIIEHNFKRFLTPEFQHIQPFWYYIPVLLVAFLPWTAQFLSSVVTGAITLWRPRPANGFTRFLACWAGFCLVFFSISRSKLPGYILPAVPAIAFLISSQAVSKTDAVRRALRTVSFLAALVFFVLFALTKALSPNMAQLNLNAAAAVGIVFVMMGLASLFYGIFFPRTNKNALHFFGVTAAILPILIVLLRGDSLVSSFFLWDPSGRTIARELQLRKIPIEELAVTNMSRGRHYSLNFYVHEEIKDWNQENSNKAYVLADRPGCRALTPIPFACEAAPFGEKHTGAFLYHVVMAGSVSGSAEGRQPNQKE
ncbi:MAG TPA: glycosyltransferase family 39 protein [Candidatus Angelobacter sp.]|nr:glycosyltransferase family 39 protein [Candidatus Angelobacter sp.]